MTKTSRSDPRYDRFPAGFFDRSDEADDGEFYDAPRLVTHIDDRAIVAVGRVYDELDLTGDVLDLCGSWISHYSRSPASLTVQGMNADELRANTAASGAVVSDLNRHPNLPFADASFDGATCCVSVDYLTRPIEVFDEIARVVKPGGKWVHTFSNRCFPTKAIRGWLSMNDEQRVSLVATYFDLAIGWGEASASMVLAPGAGGDPLYAVWASRLALPID